MAFPTTLRPANSSLYLLKRLPIGHIIQSLNTAIPVDRLKDPGARQDKDLRIVRPSRLGGIMLVPKVKLIPTQDQVLDLLKETGALREGHIQLPNGMHSSLYFQMPLAMRYHGNARTLNVALSRLLRLVPEVLAALPDCAIVAPAAGGIPVAFGVREALDAEQIFWAEKGNNGVYFFRQYLDARG